MFSIKEAILWMILFTAFTPLAFLLVPLMILAVIIGGFIMGFNGSNGQISDHRSEPL